MLFYLYNPEIIKQKNLKMKLHEEWLVKDVCSREIRLRKQDLFSLDVGIGIAVGAGALVVGGKKILFQQS